MTSETTTLAETQANTTNETQLETPVPDDTSAVQSPIVVETLPVEPPKPIDWDAINARITKNREEQAKNLALTRATLRSTLLNLGVTEVNGEYDGYGDSGNTECVSVEPSSVTIDATLDDALRDFIWDMAYQQSPGFEINEGAFGTLVWDVTDDNIAIEHNERFISSELTTFEGL